LASGRPEGGGPDDGHQYADGGAALLIDYMVTVAVQTAAGSAAIVSAFPALSRIPVIGPRVLLVISVAATAAILFTGGNTSFTGMEPGHRIRLHGMVGIGDNGRPTMVNPRYELLR
jgi:hypothetical protein